MKATAAVMHRVNEPLSIEQVDLDAPARNEVLIRTAFAGVCHSDLHYMEGLYPRACPCVLGHESSGGDNLNILDDTSGIDRAKFSRNRINKFQVREMAKAYFALPKVAVK